MKRADRQKVARSSLSVEAWRNAVAPEGWPTVRVKSRAHLAPKAREPERARGAQVERRCRRVRAEVPANGQSNHRGNLHHSATRRGPPMPLPALTTNPALLATAAILDCLR